MEAMQPLSILNTLFLFLAELANGNSCEMIVIDGPVDTDILAKSLPDVVRAHPHLRTKIVKKGKSYYKVVSKALPQIPIEEKVFDGASEELNGFLSDNIWSSAPVDVFQGPPLKIILTRSDQRTYLQVLSSHVWSDAKAGYLLLNDIMRAYNARADGKPSDLKKNSEAGPVFDASMQSRLSEMGRSYSKRAVLKSLFRDMLHAGGGAAVKPASGIKTRFVTTEIGDAGFMQQFKRASKSAGVTVHSFLVAALTKALRQHDERLATGKNKYRIHDMFSLRDHVDGFDDVYDCCVLPFDFNCDWNANGDQRLASTSKELVAIKDGRIFEEYFKVKFMLDVLKYLPRPASSRAALKYLVDGNVLCTNPGIIPFDYACMGQAPVADFYSFSQVFPPGDMMFVFTTFRQSFRLATVYNERTIDRPAVEMIISDMVAELNRTIVDMNDHHEMAAGCSLAFG